jgi:exodeoxyribonuclease III
MKLISWNVNGLRAVLKKGFFDFLKQEKPDVLGLQEIKISKIVRETLDLNFPGYIIYWNSALRPGYSGTLFLVKENLAKKISYIEGLGKEEFDIEGRVQTLEFPKFYLLNIYFPNANSELSRLDYKLRFNEFLLKFVKKLEKKKPVIISGDFNVAHQEIDLARPQENEGVAGFTKEERAWLNKLEKHNFVDSFRFFFPNKIQYTWWSFRTLARARNVGWRIDYFWLSKKFIKNLKKSYILDKVLGSDHAPVVIELKN